MSESPRDLIESTSDMVDEQGMGRAVRSPLNLRAKAAHYLAEAELSIQRGDELAATAPSDALRHYARAQACAAVAGAVSGMRA